MNENKNRKKRIVFLVAGILLIALVLSGAGLTLRAQEKLEPGADFDVPKEDTSQIIITGSGYSINQGDTEPSETAGYQAPEIQDAEISEDQISEEQVQEEKPQTQNNQEDNNQEDNKPHDSNLSQTQGQGDSGSQGNAYQGNGDQPNSAQSNSSQPSNNEQNNNQQNTDDPESEVTINKNPTIICSLIDGQRIPYSDFSFTVKGVDYRNRIIDAFNYRVTLNGSLLYSTGRDGDAFTYRNPEPLADGVQEVSIYIEDEEGNSSELRYSFQVDTTIEEEHESYATLVVEARTIGKGTLLHTTERITPGESGGSFVDRVLTDYGFAPSSSGGIYSYYLSRIYSPGISAGAIVPDSLIGFVGELDMESSDPNSLGDRDFAGGSGWVYLYNYSYMGYGLSGISLNDGDEIVLCFTLNLGCEYDGTWYYYGDW